MVSVQALANTVLKKGFEENIKITPMKLQKLVYFICCKYLQTYPNSDLISERFETWKYGPVLQSIHYAFSCYKTKPINKFTKTVGNQVKVIGEQNTNAMSAVNYVWNKYKHCTGIELAELTHKECTAWCNAFMNDRRYLSEEDMKNEII